MPAGEQFRKWYPGLIPIEEQLWRAWLHEHELEFDGFDYNVHVGEGVRVRAAALEGMPELQESNARQFLDATRKKVDCVGYRPGETWVFEVEERPGHRALGQLLFYEHALPKAIAVDKQIQLCLICARIGPDQLAVFESQGVLVFQVTLGPTPGSGVLSSYRQPR